MFLTQKIGFQELLSAVRKTYAIDIDASPFAAIIHRGMHLVAFPEGRAPIVIMISASSAGRAAYEALRLVSKGIPEHVAAPIGMITADGSIATIVSFVPHVKATAQTLCRPEFISQVGTILAAMARINPNDGEAVNAFADEAAIEKIATQELGFDAAYIEIIRVMIDTMPQVRQHGDFLLSNLGVTPTGYVVAFDWEDYGRIRWPGFDGATFLLSLSHHLGEDRLLSTSPDSFLAWIDSRCGFELPRACGLDAHDFARMFVWNLAAFVHLKRDFGYGEEIGDRAVRMATQVRTSSSWLAFLRR